ncbi:hypothetical protein Q9966_016556 [Columba livia]|nr:hypothetical protein Q9966_016556 [Columba livia]
MGQPMGQAGGLWGSLWGRLWGYGAAYGAQAELWGSPAPHLPPPPGGRDGAGGPRTIERRAPEAAAGKAPPTFPSFPARATSGAREESARSERRHGNGDPQSAGGAGRDADRAHRRALAHPGAGPGRGAGAAAGVPGHGGAAAGAARRGAGAGDDPRGQDRRARRAHRRAAPAPARPPSPWVSHQNGQKRPKMAQNGTGKTAIAMGESPNGQNGPKRPKNGPKWHRQDRHRPWVSHQTAKSDPKWPKMAPARPPSPWVSHQNGPK